MIYKNIYIYQGASFQDQFELVDTYKEPLNLTDLEIQSRMSKSHYSSSFISLNATVSDAVNGKITISLDPDTTASLIPGRYVYEIVVLDLFGNVTKIVDGLAIVDPGVGITTEKYTPSY